jgi:hypothetical protein
MNELKPWVSALCISAFQISNIHAEVAVIDSFMEAGFELDGSPEGITSTYSSIESTVVGGRGLVVRGAGGWTSTLHPENGFMRYDVSTSVFAPVGQLMRLTYYAKSGEFINLLGQNAFLLKFSSLTGAGDLGITVNGNLSTLRLTGPGQVLWEYSDVPIDLHLNQINISFKPQTADFSFNLDEITAVPEPNALAFSSAALLGLIARRRRQ